MKSSKLLLMVSILALVEMIQAQTGTAPYESVAVPRMMLYSGALKLDKDTFANGITGVTFSLYKEQEGGSPLWLETQNVTVDAQGHFSVQLGSTRSDGLPADLFNSGEARWLGVQPSGEAEQPRVLLLSVPYALKAADAETIGGLPPSAFVLATSPNGGASTNTSSENAAPSPITATAAAQSPITGNTPVTTAGGTPGTIPLWDSSSDITNSILTQTGSGSRARIGINIAKPLFTLDVKGTELVRGLFEMATVQFATATSGSNSNPLNLESSAWNSSTGTYTLNHFQWQAEPVGNNTTSPGATLNLLYATDPNPPAETGLKIAGNGLFTFASGQKFPGAGTVTSVSMSAPSADFSVSGSPITNSGTLGLAWNVNPTSANTANAIVKRDASGGFSAGSITGTTTVAGSYGVSATNSNGIAMYAGGSTNGGTGIFATAGSYGVFGTSQGGTGVGGTSNTYYGVSGTSNNAYGVYGASSGGDGVFGLAQVVNTSGVEGINTTPGGSGIKGTGYPGGYFQGVDTAVGEGGEGIFGSGGLSDTTVGGIGGYFVGGPSFNNLSFGGDGLIAVPGFPSGENIGVFAGDFGGDVLVEGNLSKSGGSFKIDHPLDPANKYLYHSFVESPDMMNIYNGNVTTDSKGNAEVHLPTWFEPLNRDFRYQLTVIGQFAQAMVAREIADGQFAIKTDKPNVKVSWQVTGIRQDAWANAHRIPVEQSKPERERGFYIHPELYGAPAEKGLGWAHHPQLMKQVKELQARTVAAKMPTPKR